MAGTDQPFSLKRLWPLAVLVAGFALFFLLGLDHYFSFEVLREHRDWLLTQVENHAATAALAYVAIYAVSTAFSLPVGLVLTVVGGFLFGQLLGVVYVVFAATTGATALFLVAKTTIGDALEARMGPWMKKMEKGFQDNALSYLLIMRLVPVFPFFAVNLAPAFLGVRLKTYFFATLFGIIPGSAVYVQVGVGLSSILESGEEFTPASALTPDVMIALAGLVILSMVPIVYKKIKKNRNT
ncbi:MAG: TVP38/TMEM64 family protein [Alphaproteobacteria bacterium]|nr:TVP38/TMEM64 family protein [Alphaproteobacteria bacterium]